MPERSEAAVRALFDAFSRRDVDAALAQVSEEFELWPQGTANRLGRDAPYRGHDGLRAYLADVERVWATLQVHPTDLRVAHGGVVAFGRITGVARSEDGEVYAVEAPVIWVFKLTGDKIRSGRVVATAAEAIRAANAD